MSDTSPAPSLAALEAELAAEQDALAAERSQRDEEARADEIKAKIAQAKRERAEEAALAAAKAKHGPVGKQIATVKTLDGLVIVKRCDGVKVKKWQDENADSVNADSLRALARPCVIFPPLEAFDALIADRPVVMVEVATAVLGLAGLRMREQGKA